MRFIPEASDRTRLEIEHRKVDRHGEGWEGERDAVASEGGWPLFLAVADRPAQRSQNGGGSTPNARRYTYACPRWWISLSTT